MQRASLTVCGHLTPSTCAGFSFDWDREFSTTSPQYYKWTQWIFLQLFNKGLAYQAEVPVNWCPALGTVLANEEVIDGLSERGSHPVERLPMKQVPSVPHCPQALHLGISMHLMECPILATCLLAISRAIAQKLHTSCAS